MKITKVSTYFARPRWGFVKIDTDAGVTGWGEAVIEGKAATVFRSRRELSTKLNNSVK